MNNQKPKSNLPNSQIQATNSVVNVGGNMEDVTYNHGVADKKEQKSKEELIEEIRDNAMDYIKEVGQLNDVNQEQKVQIEEAIWGIRQELQKPQPNEQKIKSIWEPIRNISYLAAICSGISDLFDLIK